MNKPLLSLLLSTILAGSAQAQNCVNSSRCDELGYIMTKEDCSGIAILKCPFDENKFYCNSTKETAIPCNVGDLLYSDKKCYIYPSATKQKEVIGIVLDPEKRLATSFNLGSASWNGWEKEDTALENCTEANILSTCSLSGKENASKIANNAGLFGQCGTYKTSGTNAGDWWPPSAYEFITLSMNIDLINQNIRNFLQASTVETTITELPTRYWSSCERNDYLAWDVSLKNGQNPYASQTIKTYSLNIICFINY